MRLMVVTLQFAFHDIQDATVDAVTDSLVEYASDGLGAEIVFSTTRTQTDINISDPDFDNDDNEVDSFEAWQVEARKRMEDVL